MTKTGQSLAWRLTAFYIPLAIQGVSLAISYLLVGSVVAHGRFGATEYSMLAQAQAIMFLVSSIGNGLISTGMIFAKTKQGLRNFKTLSLSIGIAANSLQALCCVPPFDQLVFGRLYHLDGELFQMARFMLLFSVPMNCSFFLRNPGLVTLFCEKRTDKATLATIARIVLAWIGSIVFVRAGLVGWKWGLFLSTVSVFAETSLMNAFARPYQRRLPEADGGEVASVGRQFAFTLPLSLGGTMLCISATMIPVFLALTPDPVVSREIHYIAFGVINMLSSAATRMQSVTIAFPPEENGGWRVFAFSVTVGTILAAASFLLQVPLVANWYFGSVQNLSQQTIPLTMRTMLVFGITPLVFSVRSYLEGLAAIRMRPSSILADQIAYLAGLLLVFFVMVHLAPIPGYLMSAVSMVLANVASLAVIRIALYSNRIADDYGTVASPSRWRGR